MTEVRPTPLFRKLNLTTADLVVLDAPASFEPELAAQEGVRVHRDAHALPDDVRFALVFATRQVEVDAAAARLATRARGDVTLWFAYPKGSSKRLRCEFNRDTGWAGLGALGFEPVRQVAIDEDWSALRFRRVEHIRVMRRAPAGALTEEGREKATRSRG
jgi:hypothetical protein